MEDKTYTLREASRELGIPTYTLRKFCDQSLIYGIRRKRTGYRILNAEQVEQLRFLNELRNIGFSFADLKKFVKIARRGNNGSILERKAMLETKKRQMWQQLQDLQGGIDFAERQIELLDKAMSKTKL